MINQERAQYMHKGAAVDLSADSRLLISLYGRIAQLVRALASHARGRRFKSYCDHHSHLFAHSIFFGNVKFTFAQRHSVFC